MEIPSSTHLFNAKLILSLELGCSYEVEIENRVGFSSEASRPYVCGVTTSVVYKGLCIRCCVYSFVYRLRC